MAVFRVQHTRNYTVMSNQHLRDKRLSLKAKGLLSQMLSLPEDWDYTLAGLASINAEGKDAIRAAVLELEKAGYVQRRQSVDQDGRFGANEYVIYERPRKEALFSDSPLPENPTADSPPPEPAPAENPTQLNKDIPITQKPKKEIQNKDFLLSGPCGTQAPPPEGKGCEKNVVSFSLEEEMDRYRQLLRENVDYDGFVRERPQEAGRLDELLELMLETICTRKKTVRIAGSDFLPSVVKSRFLKLDGRHIRYVFDCLRKNTTQVRNVRQYLLTALYNAPVTMENHRAVQGGGSLLDLPGRWL